MWQIDQDVVNRSTLHQLCLNIDINLATDAARWSTFREDDEMWRQPNRKTRYQDAGMNQDDEMNQDDGMNQDDEVNTWETIDSHDALSNTYTLGQSGSCLYPVYGHARSVGSLSEPTTLSSLRAVASSTAVSISAAACCPAI